MTTAHPVATGTPAGPAVGMPATWRDIDTPALVLDRSVLDRNIAAMQARADRAGVGLRPHVKTHKCLRIVEAQLKVGAIGVTVAKLDEAAMLIDSGAASVLVANQIVTTKKIARAISLSQHAELILGVDSHDGINMLAEAARNTGVAIKVSIEIDCGLCRCGVVPDDAPALAGLVANSPDLRLAGVFTHGGHAYGARDETALDDAAVEECEAAIAAAEAIRARGHAVETVSIGSTPTASRFAGRAGITELRPGNYVFNDGIQMSLGVADIDACALTVAATVISRSAPERAVIDAGSKTFGLDQGAHGTHLLDHFGQMLGGDGRLVRLSEEHGVLEVPPDSGLRPGDGLRIVPNHACVASNLAADFWILDGERVVDRWPIDAAGGSR